MSRNISKLEDNIRFIYINFKFVCYPKCHLIVYDHPYICYHRLNSRFTTVLHERSFSASSQLPVVMFYITISYATWVPRSRDSPFNINNSNIVNWYRNRSAKTTSSYILLFEHCRQLNSTVSNYAKKYKKSAELLHM